MDQKKTTVRNALEQNTTNMIFYDDSFTKTSFFTEEVSNWKAPIFYIDFDLQYTGFVKSGITQEMENLSLLHPENGSLREDLKSIIAKISREKSLIVIDSLNGFFNILEGDKELGRLINSFLMLLVSAANHTKSTIIVGALSKLNEEGKWVLYNTGRSVIDNEHFTKIQLTRKENNVFAMLLNSDNSHDSNLIL
ncbi:MAG: hypothetical protein CMO18_01090 [Thaumarchaeota archaeon]|nr:hypothetical protein [Nitrososphaerota archaeon]|tara:strand:+ start:1250 stop:1831 length:582 start_codon:yes stop_codon:yes gene_type:complete